MRAVPATAMFLCSAMCTIRLKLNGVRQEEGLALFGLSASPDGLLYKDSIVRFWGPRPHGLPYHTLSHGDIVLISQTKPGEPIRLSSLIVLPGSQSCYSCRSSQTLPGSSNLSCDDPQQPQLSRDT